MYNYNICSINELILQVVSNPIDMIKIQQKIKTDEYDDVDDLQADLELLTNNAKSFYKVNYEYVLYLNSYFGKYDFLKICNIYIYILQSKM